jgi:hypothetical protein
MARQGGLTKYDAPLKIQAQKGGTAFKRGHTACPFNANSMQAREWWRGWNNEYFTNLSTVIKLERHT